MIRIVTAYDDLDTKLGTYFIACKEDIAAVIKAESEINDRYLSTEISGINCNQAYLDVILSDHKEIPFLWISYTHGNEKEITVNGCSFVKAGNDNSYFQESFFYTNSCLSGKFLGPDLIAQNCKVFIGYDDTIVAFKNEHREVSVKCDNIGLITFLTTTSTAYESFEAMQSYYTQESNRIFRYGDPLSSALLINAREALVFHGEKDFTKEDLDHEE